MDRQPGEVGNRLIVANQQPDQQRGATVVEVHRPQHLLIWVWGGGGGGRQDQDCGDQLQQRRLIVWGHDATAAAARRR